MKYKGVGTKLGHRLIIRSRETAFDKSTPNLQSSFGTLEDHKEMKTWEYAAFQKKQFEKKRKEKRKRRIIFIISAILAILAFPLLFYVLRNILGPIIG